MATVSVKGGFTCEFVEKPPEVVQSECPVCQQILCEPYQAPCCGQSFCRVCKQKIKTDNKPCPTCKEVNFATFHNKGLEISLYKFQVYCSHKQEGCEWKGELGQLDNHLNLSPQPDKQLEGCEYSEIECIYCSELIKRPNITVHQDNLCPKRSFSCEYCHSYESDYDDVINNHWPVCGYQTVQCPNECGTALKRQVLENHVIRSCPKTVIDCDFHHVGCDVRLPRKDMPAHLNENLVTHMSLQAASYSKLLASHSELQSQVNKMEVENKLLKNELEDSIQIMDDMKQTITELQSKKADKKTVSQLMHHIGLPAPLEIIMPNYEQHKKDRDAWYSPPFYTHPRGYKMQLRVDTSNGYSKGTHLSVNVCLMKGEFDNHLKWPYRGMVTIQLVDQETGKGQHTLKISFTDETPSGYANRVTRGERNTWGWGCHDYLSHDRIWSQYYLNDCLRFRIKKVECQ